MDSGRRIKYDTYFPCYIIVFLLILFTYIYSSGLDKEQLTVTRRIYSQFGIKTDILMASRTVDFSHHKPDLYFASRYFHIPVFLPTVSFMKDSAQRGENNKTAHPLLQKTYTYDNTGKVISMLVTGESIITSYTYRYNTGGRVVGILEGNKTTLIINWNTDGSISSILYTLGRKVLQEVDFLYN
jgi:hypothetical protein